MTLMGFLKKKILNYSSNGKIRQKLSFVCIWISCNKMACPKSRLDYRFKVCTYVCMCGNMKIARTYVIKLQITHTHIYRIMRPTINMCLISHYTLGANASTTKNCLYISFSSKTPLNNHFVCAYHLICCTEAVEKLG